MIPRTAALGFLLHAASASAIVLCTTPDGQQFAGDHPPPDCKVTSAYENPPVVPPTAEEIQAAAKEGTQAAIDDAAEKRRTSVLASAIRERRSLEDDLNDLASDLIGVRNDIANVPAVNPTNYRDTPLGWQQYQEDLQANQEYRIELRQKEGQILAEMSSIRKRFDELTSHVRTELGAVPPSWASLRCTQCP
jgi:hypothetical protein